MTSDRKIKSLHKSLVKKWRDRLWLGSWKIYPRTEETVDSNNKNGMMSLGATDAEAAYRTAIITLSMKAAREVAANNDFTKFNRNACHEMVHVATSPTQEFINEVLDELPQSKRPGFKRWWRTLDESQTEHWVNVLLDLTGELE